MVKGGARIASAKKAVAKGMGINIFFSVLEKINEVSNWTSVNTIMDLLPEIFGGERNETCRSYFKELWRYGLIDRRDKLRITECNAINWKKGGRPKYKISKKGKRLLEIPDKHRVFALAWLLVKLDNKNDFEQLHLTFNTLRKRELPLNYFEACKITGVVRDSIKAIMYGWLEPLGFIYRTNNGTFKLDNKYYNLVNSFKSIKEAVPSCLPNKIKIKDLTIETLKNLGPYAPEERDKIDITFKVKYSGSKKIKIKINIKIHPLFYNRFESREASEIIVLKPNSNIETKISLTLENKKISESFKSTELGFFEIEVDNKVLIGSLPEIFLTTKAHLHELNLSNLFSKIGYKPITFTKSDRPDMVLFPKRIEKNLIKFLHNEELKILVETTSVDTLSLQKVKDDLDNFKEHTTKVLKINAKRTLIVGKKLSKSISKNMKQLKKRYQPFTIISLEDLEYLNNKIREKKDNSWNKVGKILTYNGIVNKELINDIFS